MHTAEIVLEEWQHEALEDLARRTGKSVADVLQEILSEHLRAVSGKKGLRAIQGIGSDPEAGGEAHDQFLYGSKTR